MNKYYLKVSSFVALFAMCVALLPANAGALTTLAATSPEIDSATAGFADAAVTWTTVSDYAIGDTIRVTIDWSDTTATNQHGSSTNIAACTTPSTNLTGSFGSFTPTSAIFTLTAAQTATQAVGLCVSVPVEDVAGLYEANFSLSIITSNVNADYGAVEFYVNGGNDVLVDASVQPTLEFAVVDATDFTTEEHECHIGTLTLTNVGSCDYRLRVSTNAKNGFQITIDADQAFGAGHATLTNIGDNGTILAGTENYGVQVTDPASEGGHDGVGGYGVGITVDGIYAGVDDNPVPVGTPTNFLSYTNSFLGNSALSTTLVTHRAAIDAASVVGYYSQTVTYTVSPSF